MRSSSISRLIIPVFLMPVLFGAGFLNIRPDSVSAAMGGAGNGISRGVNALKLNPAGLVFAEDLELLISHTYSPLDSGGDTATSSTPKYEYLAAVKRIRDRAFGLDFSHYHQPGIHFQEQEYRTFSGHSSLSYARVLGIFRMGLRGKVLWEHLGGFTGAGIALDGGMGLDFDLLKFFKSLEPNFALGVSFYNLGLGVKLDVKRQSLPMLLAAGFRYTGFKSRNICFYWVNDFKFHFGTAANSEYLEIATGMQFLFLGSLALRGGVISSFSYGRLNFANINNHKFTFGGGYSYRIRSWLLGLDYSLIMAVNIKEFATHNLMFTLKKSKFAKNK